MHLKSFKTISKSVYNKNMNKNKVTLFMFKLFLISWAYIVADSNMIANKIFLFLLDAIFPTARKKPEIRQPYSEN